MNDNPQKINYISHLNSVYGIFDGDDRITVFHSALYMALFRIWNNHHFKSPIIINRTAIMNISKIRSTKTYTKTIRELHEWGYLDYAYSKANLYSSKINMFTAGVISKHVMPPLYKHINKKQNIYTGQKSIFDFEYDSASIPNPQNHDLQIEENDSSQVSMSPPLEHVKIYFNEKGASELEAEKFFNYYESLDWCTAAGNPITKWKAKARNWILNVSKFNPKQYSNTYMPKTDLNGKNSPKNHSNGISPNGVANLKNDKDYDIPL